LIKSLHEIGQLLVPLFMKRLKMNEMPTRIGCAGNTLEECLSGGLMFHKHSKDSSPFQITTLAILKVVDGKRRRFEVSDSFLLRPKKSLEAFLVREDELIGINVSEGKRQRRSSVLFLPDRYDLSNHNNWVFFTPAFPDLRKYPHRRC